MVLIRRNNSDWLSNFFDDFFNTDFMPRTNATTPAVNVKEDDEKYTMEIAAPGLKKEYCRVGINSDGLLEVKIENKLEHHEEKNEGEKEHYLRREFSYGNYEQNYSLPEDVDKEKISAKVENGVLLIQLPKVYKEGEKTDVRNITVG